MYRAEAYCPLYADVKPSVKDIRKPSRSAARYGSNNEKNGNEEEKSKVLHGMPIIPEKNLSGTVILTSAGSIAAVGTADNNLVKCLKVFI